MGSYIKSSLTKDEHIIYQAHKSLWIIIPKLISGVLVPLIGAFIISMAEKYLPSLFGETGFIHGYLLYLLVILIGLAIFIHAYIIYSSTELAFTNKRVIVKTGFIRRHAVEMKIDHVEAIQIDQNIAGRILSYGSIHITGAGELVAPVTGISAPMRFKKRFNQYQDNLK